jgi:hypothetical protein
MSSIKPLSTRIQDNLTLFVLGLLCTGFVAGWGAYEAIRRVEGERRPSGMSSESAPAQFDFLKGDWECQDHDDQFRMHITWDADSRQFVGKMTKLGKKTAAAGFKVGEIVWKGEPRDDHILSEWEEGRENPKSDSFWIPRDIDINLVTYNHFAAVSDFMRVP